MGNLSRSRRRVFKRLAKDIGQDIWLVRREVMPGDSRYGVSERKEYKKIKKLEGFLGISTAKIPIEESQPLNIGNQTVTVSSRQFQASDLTSDSLILVDNRLYHCQLERTIIRQGVVTEYVLKLLQAQEYRILA